MFPLGTPSSLKVNLNFILFLRTLCPGSHILPFSGKEPPNKSGTEGGLLRRSLRASLNVNQFLGLWSEEQPNGWQFTPFISFHEGWEGQVLSFFTFHKWRHIHTFMHSVSQPVNVYQASVYSWYNAGLCESSKTCIPFLLSGAHSWVPFFIVSWKANVCSNKWRWVFGVFCWKQNLNVDKYLNSRNFQGSFKPLPLQTHFLFYEQVIIYR